MKGVNFLTSRQMGICW